MSPRDRVGLGWRPALAAGIVSHLDRIDVLEVVAEEAAASSRASLASLRALGRDVPLEVHAVSLGLASVVPVARHRLDGLARLVGALEPESWSEHLAFVRGGGVEIGHLCAPPRTAATIEGTARNVADATRVVGARPALENVATLLEPPTSDRDEATFVRESLEASGADLLLDLHNLHANATNFRFDARAFVRAMPIERVRTIHVAGGRFVGRILDDHLHSVPAPVYALLEDVAALAPGPLTVVLERDGAFPPIESLLEELALARAALARGRAARREARVLALA